MTDVGMVDNGKIVQVWRNHTSADLIANGWSAIGMETLHDFDPSAHIVVGMMWDGTSLSTPAAPLIQATSLNRRQLIRGLLSRGYITTDEAINDPMVIPAFITAAFAQYDSVTRAVATIDYRNALQFDITNPLFQSVLPALEAAQGRSFSSDDVYAFFGEFSKII